MKKIIVLSILFNCILSAYAVTLDELSEPKSFMNRLGTSEKVEPKKGIIEITEKNEEKTTVPVVKKAQNEEKNDINNINQTDEINEKEAENTTDEIQEKSADYADLSLKKLALDVAYDLEADETKINSDLMTLWAATTERSETMKYTIYKLANPDEDKPSDSMIKKIIKPIANISSLAGASVSSNPFVAAGSLIGGGLFSAILKDDKEINYTFSKVSDADMVLLIRKIDILQKKMIDLYVDYKTKEKLYAMEKDNLKKREEIYNASQNKSIEELTIADVYYRDAKIQTQKAYDEYLTSRAILENLVGSAALAKIETEED